MCVRVCVCVCVRVSNDVHLIYTGSYAYKYIGHESANWLGSGLLRTSIVAPPEMWGGDRRGAGRQ